MLKLVETNEKLIARNALLEMELASVKAAPRRLTKLLGGVNKKR